MFNESHQRHLVSTLRHIDRMLSDAWERLSAPENPGLFETYVADASPEQRKVLGDHIAQLRYAMRRFVQAQELQEKQSPVSALHSFFVALSFAQIAVEELRPKYLTGYGVLDPDAVATAERFVAEMTTLLRRMIDYVARGEGSTLASRLAQLDDTRDEIALLRQIERIISVHGIVELRVAVERLVERAAAPGFEIAVFGRVSAGKSSLLNWWLGEEVLPTGVVPVTAVPTRILHGPTAQAHVRTVTSSSTRIAFDQLQYFVTEQGNPRNVRRVLSIEIELPAPRLAPGVCLVDTPGLGSLASVGAAQTLEYLPRCDLAIMLLEAGSVLGRDDLDVARAVLDSGSDLVVVLSKADRLSPADLSAALRYAADVLRTELGITPPVTPVSTLKDQAGLAETWFGSELEPRLAQHREQAAASLRRKIGVLRESAVAVLEARLSAGADFASVPATQNISESLSVARTAIEETRRQIREMSLQTRKFLRSILDAMTDALSECWTRRDRTPEETASQVLAAMTGRVAAAGDALSGLLGAAASQLSEAAGALPGLSAGDLELPAPRGRPVFESPSLEGLNVRAPQWTPKLESILHLVAKRRIDGALSVLIRDPLALHGDALRVWGLAHLDALSEQFELAVAPLEGSERSRMQAGAPPADADAIRRDLKILREWPGVAPGQREIAPTALPERGVPERMP